MCKKEHYDCVVQHTEGEKYERELVCFSCFEKFTPAELKHALIQSILRRFMDLDESTQAAVDKSD